MKYILGEVIMSRSEYFKYRLVSEEIDVSGNFKDAKVGQDLLLLKNLYLEKGTTKYFDLYIWISYDEEENQLDMLGTKIDSHLVISGIDAKEESICR